MKNFIYAFVFLFVLFISQVTAQTAADKLNNLLVSAPDSLYLNGSVLVAENGKVIYRKSFGYADIAAKIPNVDDSTFQTASVSKIFTSTAVLQLRDQGRIKLSDSFAQYFPEFPFPNVTIKHLLSHSSGLPDLELYESIVCANPDLIITNKDAIPALKAWQKPLKFEPGDKAEYCNTNYVLLALLVEKISGMPFQNYLKKNIFQPAGMNATYVRVASLPNAGQPPVINHILPVLYRLTPEDVEAVKLKDPVKMRRIRYETYNLKGTLGDQNVISTTGDLLKFDAALSAGKLLSAATMEEAFTPLKLNNGETYFGEVEPAYASKCSFGLGWIICENPALGRLISHDGYNRGISTMFYRNVTKKQTVIMYDNAESPGFNDKVASIVNILNGKPPSEVNAKKSVAREFGAELLNNGVEAALIRFNEARADKNSYLTKREINLLGYDFLFNGYRPQSLEAFKLNVVLFPDDFNVYDSYAEALAESGKTQEAILIYKKAIALNPKSEGSIRALAELEGKDK